MENKEYLEHIEIKGLWGQYDVDWALNPDVNILVGENGTGKSTILSLVVDFWKNGYIDGKIAKHISLKTTNGIMSTKGYLSQDSELIIGFFPLTEVEHIKLIKTFDAPFYSKSDKEVKRKPYIKSTLDDDLDVIMEKYVEYQLDKSNQLIFKKLPQEKAFGKKLLLIEALNRLFEPTRKTVDTNENKLVFRDKNNGKIQWYDLSSGEKQLLVILLTVLCQDEKPSVLLLDEPEISLDLRWQYELVSLLRQFNPNCQLIIVTHSPGIYGKGWRDKVVFMDDIVPQLKEQVV